MILAPENVVCVKSLPPHLFSSLVAMFTKPVEQQVK
jgi:hypothetical protein